MTTFSRPNQIATSRLKEFEGKVIALRWLGSRTIDTIIEGKQTTSPAVRADMLAIVDGTAFHVGEQLVFQQVLSDMLSNTSTDPTWLVGRLVKTPSESFDDRSYYILEDLDDADYLETVEEFEAVLA
jgi:hypothetical protein